MRVAFYLETGKPTTVGSGALLLQQDDRGWFSLQGKMRVYYVERRRVICNGTRTFKLGSQIKSKENRSI
jgi:hypothetical protein